MNYRSQGCIKRSDYSLLLSANRVMWIRLAFVFVSGCVLVASSASAQISFTPLGDLPGGQVRSQAMAISGDGLVVVGSSSSALTMQRNEAFRWTSQGGMIGLGAFSNSSQPPDSFATGASADGAVVVGADGIGLDMQAFRWTAAGGKIRLGLLPGDPPGAGSVAWSTSADGSVVVGQSGLFNEAFRWTAAEGMVPLGNPPGETVKFSDARGVSADGTVIVGRFEAIGGGQQAYRWTSQTGIVLLGGSFASAVSADGSVVVGFGGPEAFRWTAQSGRVPLGDLPGGRVRSFANDVSADGSIVVGFGETAFDGSFSTTEAYFWSAPSGMVNLGSFLVSQGLDLTGWSLTTAEGVSADGHTIVGTGLNPAGNQEAWMATIPEPSTMTLSFIAAAGVVGLATRRRRQSGKT